MRIRNIIVIVFMLSCVTAMSSSLVHGQAFQSEQYRIESGSFELDPELTKPPLGYDLSSNFGPTAQQKFKEKGYAAISREDADSVTRPFIRLQVPHSQLFFNEAEVGDESLQRNTLRILGNSVTQFIVGVRQDSAFANNFGATISPMVCDIKDAPCTPVSAGFWKKSYGFGYRLNGALTDEFRSRDNFRPFYTETQTGRFGVLYSGEVSKDGKNLDLVFKLRPQPQKQTGLYKSTVIVTATADY